MLRALSQILGLNTTPRLPTFRYKYLRNPFDTFQYFSVQAADQEAANELAIDRFTEMFKDGWTVMREFWPA